MPHQLLKVYRLNKGYTQENAADMLNVSVETVSKWERGLTYPNLKHIKAIFHLYQCSNEEVFAYINKVFDLK